MTGAAIFYSPVKAADRNRGSGLPRVASLWTQAIEQAGYRIDTPALPVTFENKGDPQIQSQLLKSAAAAAAELLTELKSRAEKPALWFTYHSYYKSPDVIGPLIAKDIGCPYVIAEGSFASKRAAGPWELYHRAALASLRTATFLLASTTRDREGLIAAKGAQHDVIDFPPFVDASVFAGGPRSASSGPIRILTAGAMRDARKIESYVRLMAALSELPNEAYTLTIAGDGPEREAVERAARSSRVSAVFLGELPPSAMPSFFASGDMFVWPGVGEAFGLTYLEAQAAGLPVVAGNYAGVSAVVRDGVSGILTDPAAPKSLATAIKRLIDDTALRERLGRSAQDWVFAERDVGTAALRLRRLLDGRRP
jgi:glycosyltransferase involved in cell wall biosynthesis